MQSFFSLWGQHRGAAWVWGLLVLGLCWLRPEAAQASHIRAGDIQAQVDSITGNPNHIYFRLTVYRDVSGVAIGPASIYYGDGNCEDIPLSQSTSVINAAAKTEIVRFTFEHTYAGAARYTVSYVEDNRNAGVVNMSNSNAQSFYIATSITINPVYGRNHSPVLRAPAIDRAGVQQVFLHNPAGYDADGDSLAYKLIDCQQVNGGKASITNCIPRPVKCDNYRLPSDPSITPVGLQVAYAGVPAGVPRAPGIIVQDVSTGQITWNAPGGAGIFNIAFIVEEWRRSTNGRLMIGGVIRDMQIIVEATNNLPPTLTVPTDLCVVANTPATFTVSATDGTGTGADAPSPVTLFAYSGILPPATFVQTTTGTSVTGRFNWTPSCSNVSSIPYVVVIKAQDKPVSSTTPILIDEKVVRITVIGPAPQNVKATATTSNSKLASVITWNSYACTNASQLLLFRRENSYPYTPGSCETGLPAGSGYEQIATLPVTATTYTDDKAGAGLSRGMTYSYRLYATYPLPARSNSQVSAEALATFPGKSAKFTNVDVTTTNATQGEIALKWTQPRNFNNAPFPAPAGYRLTRAEGSSATFAPVATITNLSDTTYVDRGLNTTGIQYTYKLVFYNTVSGVEQAETAATASSVRVTPIPNGNAKTITVSWTQQVPWDNTKQPTIIYRLDPAPGSVYRQVATATSGATGGSYTDADPTLVRDQSYCYYVQTNGQYPDVNSLNNLLLTNLLNRSQQQCVVLTAAPCTPVLSLLPTNCDSLAALPSFPETNQRYQNKLRWTVGNTPAGCDVAATGYRVLRSDAATGQFVQIATTTRLDYVDRFLDKANYCYAVQAIGTSGLSSANSNAVCQDNCAFFTLPNIFTPNNDGINDVFKPKVAAGIKSTHIQVFNRWGRKVFEGDDPYINWTGGGVGGESGTSGMVSGGLYYYLAEVQFDDAAQTKRTFKGWVEVVR